MVNKRTDYDAFLFDRKTKRLPRMFLKDLQSIEIKQVEREVSIVEGNDYYF
jgi:hypothetical protein